MGGSSSASDGLALEIGFFFISFSFCSIGFSGADYANDISFALGEGNK
jgi:hypothetical protein